MPPDPLSRSTSRRTFLRGTVGAGRALAALGLTGDGQWLRGAPATSVVHDYTSREAFDHYDRAWNDGNGNADRNNEHGALGWGEGWLLAAYVVMYRAHRDAHYFDKLVAHVDQVLRQRDSVRNVTDWRSRSLPSWRCTGDYTCGTLALNDAEGRPLLTLRSAARPAHRLSVAVAGGTSLETFKVVATFVPVGKKDPVEDVYDGLSMIPSAPSYAVRRINDAFAETNGTKAGPRTMLTASDARPENSRSGNDAPRPTSAPEAMKAMPFVFAVQVGQILTPVAAFVRLVRDTPDLQLKYGAKADEYLDAIEQAVAVHDEEWREDAATGEGWLAWPKGSPNAFDGCDQPHNQYLSLGRVMIHLSALARDADRRALYRDRATKMARTFKNDLKPTKAGGVTWPYFWSKGRGYRGWTAADEVSQNQPTMVWPKTGGFAKVEDTSHGVLDVDFARLAVEYNLGVFDASDLRTLARTFTRQILTASDAGHPTTFENVDGTGRQGALDNAAAGWLPLAAYEPGMFDAVRSNYQARQPKPGSPTILLGIAHLNALSRGA